MEQCSESRKVRINEFHKDEAAQKGQRSGADAEEEKITCNNNSIMRFPD